MVLAPLALLLALQSPPVTLVGRVVDPEGEPVVGATVRQVREVTYWGARTGGTEVVGTPVRTDEDGRYAVERAGLHVFLKATADGFGSARTERLTMKKGESGEVAVPDLVLRRAWMLVGIVTSDADGEPIEGAYVVVVAEDDLRGVDALEAGVGCAVDAEIHHHFTDARGRYEIDGLGDRAYRIVVAAEEHCHAVRAVDEPFLDVVLAKETRTLSGRLVDPAGRPIAGADVVALARSGPERMHRVAGTTAEDGTFALHGLIDETYDVRAAAAGMTPLDPVRARAGEVDLRLMLARLGRVAGRVVHADGSPAPDAVVVVYVERGGKLDWLRSARLEDGPGAFSIDPLPPGRYVLDARHPTGARARSAPIDVEHGTTLTDLELRLPAP